MLPERVAIPIRVLGLGTPQKEKKQRTAIRPRSTKVSYAGCTEKTELEVRQSLGHSTQLYASMLYIVQALLEKTRSSAKSSVSSSEVAARLRFLN